jgi:hypothetical protein
MDIWANSRKLNHLSLMPLNKMKKQNSISTFLFLVTTLSFAAFVNGQSKGKDSIECFELRTNLQGYFLRDSADPVQIKYLYSMGEYSMYCVPVYSSKVTVELVGDELVTKDTLKKWIAYDYFIYKNDKTIGREYSSEFKNASRPFNVDSLLAKDKVVFFTNIEKYKCAADSILPNSDLLRTFVLKASEENFFADTVYFVYKKCNRDLQFEFMKAIDTVKDYRVVKKTSVYDSEWKQYLKDKKNRPFFRELYHELMPAQVQDYDKVYSLFQRFIKDTAQ